MEVVMSGYDKTFEIQCNKCKSDLKYTLADIEQDVGYKDIFTGQTIEGTRYIICPVCGKSHRVD